MIVCSYNIRGLGSLVKRRRIKELIQSHKIDFIAIQETKLEGNSGGILSPWRKTNSSLIFTFMGEGFVGVCLVWVVVKKKCCVINIYAKCDLNAKRRLWENILMSKLGFGEGGWVVKECWGALNVSWWMGHILKEKLKALKVMIKEWNKRKFGKMEESIVFLISCIKEKDLRGEEGLLSTLEVEERKKLFEELWRLLKSKEVGSRWLEESSEIIEEVSSYFKNQFSSSYWVRTKLDRIVFPSISVTDNIFLTAPFVLKEIEEVVWKSEGNKSPGPDGFNIAFVKSFWDMMKGEVRIMFDQFHGNACLSKGLLSYFIALILKVAFPSSLGEFRPNSLLGCLYKVAVKVLVARLAKVIDSVVASMQSAFIKGRNLVDGVMLVNEVIDLAKKLGRECLVLKVDFKKAYDSVDWGFLEYMLRRFGFENKWIEWIRACVFAGNLSVLVNGSPTSEINIQLGLKQGDPLAPFLFPFGGGGVCGVDAKCGGEESFQRVSYWVQRFALLRGFELASGLKVNFWKSCLMGVNVSSHFMTMACNFLNCKQGAVPFTYLGLPVGANPRRASTWEPLVDQLRRRLRSWRHRYMPTVIIKNIVRIQREFLWGGVKGGRKISWVSWKEVCRPRSEGGLGVRDARNYGPKTRLNVHWIGHMFSSRASMWWKDICGIDIREDGSWFARDVTRRLGWLGIFGWKGGRKWVGDEVEAEIVRLGGRDSP
ncbi:hypothetical protein TSUD_240270 [Trifolium subterraneum]|uniref:Reverse transcriptase domain-containing protein n=1 Tax=Trifolium subterraneum TaxID=3900 RepID=A0A2Z6P4E5_TRISU|nr:hypothetical protein TSUD_240270 [Trifolium subterraneum]